MGSGTSSQRPKSAAARRPRPARHDTVSQSHVNLKTERLKQLEEIEKNTKDETPVPGPATSAAAGRACVRGTSRGKWPIRNYLQLDLNVNRGGAALLQCANTYGAEGSNTTAETLLLRCGVEGNHFQVTSLGKCNAGHFGAENRFVTLDDGTLLPDLMFGTNYMTVLSNNYKYGHLGHGVIVESDDGVASLPLNVNGPGNCLILATSVAAGLSEATFHKAIYMIRFGHKDNYLQAVLLSGDDKWVFSASDAGGLQAQASGRSRYGLFHNRDNLDNPQGAPQCRTRLLTSHNGLCAAFKSLEQEFVGAVICSHEQGPDDATAAAVYLLTMDNSKSLTSQLIAQSCGKGYSNTSGDIWKFDGSDGLAIKGPDGPCRYAVLTNLKEDVCDVTDRLALLKCPFTGSEKLTDGTVTVTEDKITGIISRDLPIKITLNEAHLTTVVTPLRGPDGFSFEADVPEDKVNEPGIYMIRVFAVLPQSECSTVSLVELEGSPYRRIVQARGVLYALNCGGPTYHALNDVVFINEKEFINYTYEFNCGSRHVTYGGPGSAEQSAHMFLGTSDGPLYSTSRTSGVEAVDEQKVHYKINFIPNGDHFMRIYTTSTQASNMILQDQDISNTVTQKLQSNVRSEDSSSGYEVTVPVNVSKNTIDFSYKGHVSAFIVVTSDFKDKEKSGDQDDLKLRLSEELQPIPRTLVMKKMQIAGWSPNLLYNCSGETADMSGWNVTGNWSVADGGYGTEKKFVSSHMDCMKYQEIDLMEHFTEQYMDTAPEIQASEWYREGACGGGFYQYKVQLLDKSGQTIKSYDSGRIGSLYKNNQWFQSLAVFADYGPGARTVTVETFGKDDKFWAGHYGPFVSNCVVRVKQEQTPMADDLFGETDKLSIPISDYNSMREKLVSAIVQDNQEHMIETETEQVAQTSIQANSVQATHLSLKPRRRKKREIRVFVSSTFRDFQTEREQLIKKTFREVNRICADRGVFFTYVDLRWGITEEQTSHGETITICLQEIERCRPYFLCLMGERFGWSQKDADNCDKLLNQSFDYAMENFRAYDWLETHRYGSSVTQLEIMHGVLNDMEQYKNRSFFYLREDMPADTLSESDKKIYLAESEWHAERQTALRQNITSNNKTLNVRSYSGPESVCELIKQDLQYCVDQDFPQGSKPTALEREREAHQAFGDARKRVYIGREEYFSSIDETLQKGAPLVVLGESGSGKSALVANWVARLEEKEPNTFVFLHFIGSSAESASHIKLLRRLFEELKLRFAIEMSVPHSDDNLSRDLLTWLRAAGARGQVVLVFDALNQLVEGGGAEGSVFDLRWIPQELPPGVRLLLSTLPGPALDAVQAAGWPTLEVKPLNPGEKGKIITEYLENIYGKKLSEDQKTLMTESTQTDNALYLKALLDEVRIYGSFRQLTSKIQEYLSAQTPSDLFAKILERLEQDFEKGQHKRVNLVRDTCSAIWCSNRGMSEAELLDILQIPSAIWSPFYLSLIDNLVNRNGILNFFHDHLRQAVEKMYLPNSEDKIKTHLLLAQYFSQKPIDERVVQELPFLWEASGKLPELKSTITNLKVFSIMTQEEEGKFDLIKYWKLLGGFELAEEAYLQELKSSVNKNSMTADRWAELEQDMAEFLTDLGFFSSARSILESLLIHLEEGHKDDRVIVYNAYNHSWKYVCAHQSVIEVYNKLGLTCQKENKLNESLNYYKTAAERLYRIRSPDRQLQLVESLLGQATVQVLLDNMKEGRKLLLRARELATAVLGPRHHYVATIINKLGQLSYSQGRLDEARGLFLQDLQLTMGSVGTAHPRTAAVLNDLALVYDDQGNVRAGELYTAVLRTLCDLYGNQHIDVAKIRYNLGAFFYAHNSFQRAKYQFSEALQVFELFLGPQSKITETAKTALAAI